MVAFMIAPLAAETILDEGPVTSKPSADWMKLIVAAESSNACFMALPMTSFLLGNTFWLPSFFQFVVPIVEQLSKGGWGCLMIQQSTVTVYLIICF